MVCPKCGKPVSREDLQCLSCGAFLTGDAGKTEEADEVAKGAVPSGGRDRRSTSTWIMVGIAVVGVVVVLGLVLGTRGGPSGGSALPEPGANQAEPASSVTTSVLQTYTDSTYGFSLECPPGWQVVQGGEAAGAAGSTSAGQVSVVDPSGAMAGAALVDLASVSVYRLNTAVDESMMADVKPELEQVVADLQSQGADTQILEPLSPITVAGLPGFGTTMEFVTDGVAVTSALHFLFSGDIEYQVTTQAATTNWDVDQPVFDALLASFRPGAAS